MKHRIQAQAGGRLHGSARARLAVAAVKVALLAGGTGGAKLAVGLRDLLHGLSGAAPELPGKLSVIANTADDIEIYGVHVSPDPDLITFRLAGVLSDQGFGIEGEGHSLMDARRAAGEEIWFELGDDDMAVCAARAEALAAGRPLTEAHALATTAYDTGGAGEDYDSLGHSISCPMNGGMSLVSSHRPLRDGRDAAAWC